MRTRVAIWIVTATVTAELGVGLAHNALRGAGRRGISGMSLERLGPLADSLGALEHALGLATALGTLLFAKRSSDAPSPSARLHEDRRSAGPAWFAFLAASTAALLRVGDAVMAAGAHRADAHRWLTSATESLHIVVWLGLGLALAHLVRRRAARRALLASQRIVLLLLAGSMTLRLPGLAPESLRAQTGTVLGIYEAMIGALLVATAWLAQRDERRRRAVTPCANEGRSNRGPAPRVMTAR